MRLALWGSLFLAIVVSVYFLGISHEKQRIATLKIEELTYDNQRRQKIYSQPHISRNRALQLFNQGVL